ncbi:hypothetical protein P3L10_014717 [Capsicum annuum]
MNTCCDPSVEKHLDILAGKLFPAGFFAAISAPMFCFYSYVILSGDNPPPKKLKASASDVY